MTTTPITQFRGEWACFSNFFPAKVMYEGEWYRTVEHAFQAAKSMDPLARTRLQLAQTPQAAKALGRMLTLRSDWEDVKRVVMGELVTYKFMAYQDLRQVLIASAPRVLQEGNSWGDRFWGIDLATGKGENHLGRILMTLRDRLVLSKELQTP